MNPPKPSRSITASLPVFRSRPFLRAALPLLLALLGGACRHGDQDTDAKTPDPSSTSGLGNGTNGSYRYPGSATDSLHTDSTVKTSGHALPVADTATFFPLVKGSYWIYEVYRNGNHVLNSRLRDSVLEVARVDSGYRVDVGRTFADRRKNVLVRYRVDPSGLVWAESDSTRTFYPYMSLHPDAAKPVGLDIHACSSPSELDSDCVELEAKRFPDSTHSGEPKPSESHWTFRKGVGLTRKALPDQSLELVEYRIGAGPVGLTAFSPEAADAMAFISKIYADFHHDNTDFDHLREGADTIFSPKLRDLIHQDAKQAGGEVGYLDGDPICDCQDYDIADVYADFSRAGNNGPTGVAPEGAATVATTPANVAPVGEAPANATLKADVHFKNFGNTFRIGLNLIRTEAGWRIADIQSESTPSLVDALRNYVGNPKNQPAR